MIGAGLAGLSAARDLAQAGLSVTVLEKSRGVGGRTASRRIGDLQFDHGAARLHDGADGAIATLGGRAPMRLRRADGGVEQVDGGLGAANAPAKTLAEGLEIERSTRAHRVEGAAGRVRVTDEGGAWLLTADAAIITAPAPQTAELVGAYAPELAARASVVRWEACWSVMVDWAPGRGPAGALGPDGLDIVDGDGGALGVAIRQSALPERASGERWVLQGAADWSEEQIEAETDAAVEALLSDFARAAELSFDPPSTAAAHRWRYARPVVSLPDLYLSDGPIFVAGDWCGGRTAGAAVRSGRAAAAALLGSS